MNTATQNLPLIISDTFIHQDAESRYCLNDVHKAAGENPKHQPSNWLRLDSTKELIEEVSRCSEMSNRSSDLRNGSSIMMNPIEVKQGGNQQGTYAVKELVYAYAMWISPAFSLKVIRAYDALVSGQLIQNAHAQQLLELKDQVIDAQNAHIQDTNTLITQGQEMYGVLAELHQYKVKHMESLIKPSPKAATPDEVKAIIRCRAENYTHGDIAELLGRTVDSVQKISAKWRNQGGAL